MSNFIDKIIDDMQYPILTRITSVPAYDAIKIINNELTGNAAIAPKNLGCGTVYCAWLILTAAIYAKISIAAWIPPFNPGIQPHIYTNTTGPQITSINHIFDQGFTI